MTKCKVSGCNNKHAAKGFCNIHYQRVIRNIPLDGNPKKTVMERLFEKIVKSESGCWLWTGATSGGDGRHEYKYGYINIDGKATRAHRVLYEKTNNISLGEKHLLHKCDNPKCVNPNHLFIGTYKDNSDDMIAKGRDRHPRGEDNHSKLTESQVLEIRKRSKLGHSAPMIAKDYPVCSATIINIVNRKKWKHI